MTDRDRARRPSSARRRGLSSPCRGSTALPRSRRHRGLAAPHRRSECGDAGPSTPASSSVCRPRSAGSRACRRTCCGRRGPTTTGRRLPGHPRRRAWSTAAATSPGCPGRATPPSPAWSTGRSTTGCRRATPSPPRSTTSGGLPGAARRARPVGHRRRRRLGRRQPRRRPDAAGQGRGAAAAGGAGPAHPGGRPDRVRRQLRTRWRRSTTRSAACGRSTCSTRAAAT